VHTTGEVDGFSTHCSALTAAVMSNVMEIG